MLKRFVFLLLAVAILALCVAVSQNARHDGRVVIAGSSCMGKMTAALAEGFLAEHGGLAEAQLGGTQLGLIALGQGACDIASCSRGLSDAEKALFEEHPAAIDAIAVIVHPKNPLCDIKIEELAGIYSGDITDWAQLGGSAAPIVVIGREAGSGTRSAFDAAIGTKGAAAHTQEHSETGMLRTAVAMTPCAIGYISFDYVDDSVKALSIGGALPVAETVYGGGYPLAREFVFCVKRGERRAAVRAFLDYAAGERGQRLIASLGMLPYEESFYAPL